jgi:excisionase family DNA binding protein
MKTVRQAAEILQVSIATVYALCAARKLRHVRIGFGRGSIRVPEEAIREYVDQQMVAATGPKPAPPPSPPRPLKFLHLD